MVEQVEEKQSRFTRSYQEIVVAAVFCVFFVGLRLGLDAFVQGRRGATFIEPDFWPSALLTFATVLSVAYLAKSVLAVVRERGGDGPAAGQDEPTPVQATTEEGATAAAGPLQSNYVVLVSGFGLLFGYVFVMSIIGFVPSTLLFCVAFLLFLGERRWAVVAGFPVLIVVLLLGVFTRLLSVPLPRGEWIFVQLSTFFY